MLDSEEIDAAPRDKTVAVAQRKSQSGEAATNPVNQVSKDDSKGQDAQPTVVADGTTAASLLAAIQIAPSVTPEAPKTTSETSGAAAGLSTLIAVQTQPALALPAAGPVATSADQSFGDALGAAAGSVDSTHDSAAPTLKQAPAAATAAASQPASPAPVASTVQISVPQVSSTPDLAINAQVLPSTPVQAPAPIALDAKPTTEAAAEIDPKAAVIETANVAPDAVDPADLQAKQATIAAGADKSAATLAAPAAPSVTAAKTEKTDQPSTDKDGAKATVAAEKPVVAAHRNGAGGDPKQSGADQGKSGEGAQAQTGAAQPDNSGGAFTLTQGSNASRDGSPDAVAGQSATNAGASTAATLAAGIVAAAANAGAGSRRTRLEVRLDESDLGRIDVRLDISQDGRVSTRLTIDRPETLAMLRNDASELTRNLQQAGFTMNGGGLSFELRDGGGQGFAGRDQQQASVQQIAAAEPEDDLIVTDQITAAYRGARSATSALDVRV